MRTRIRNLLKKIGYDIVKYNPPFTTGKQDAMAIKSEYSWLTKYKFKNIIDVGANQGQFSEKMRVLFPDALIYAFEPIPEVYDQLTHNFHNDAFFKGYNLGAGAVSEERILFLNEYSPSSSILPMTNEHIFSFDHAKKTNPVTVKIERLDNVFKDHFFSKPLLVKIDVQGFEDKVIMGGRQVLSEADIVICELSYVELFEGQVLFEKVYNLFKEIGFLYAGSIEQLRSNLDNKVLQEDGVFIKQQRD